MGMQTKLVMGWLAVLAVWGAPRPAEACSFIRPCAPRPTLALVGDVASRPLNACIGVQYAEVPWYSEPLIAPELAYVAADGTRIALEATDTGRVYCPTQALAPDTDYVLVGPERDTSDYDCRPLAEVELLAFHTGSAADTTPPSAPGLVEDVECFHDVCDSSSCCGPYDDVAHRSVWSAATDDGAETAYVVDGELRVDPQRRWSERSATQPTHVWVFDTEPRDVRAIDVAGNIGEAAMHGEPCVPAPIELDAGVPDAFTPSAPDAGVVTSPDAAMSSGGGGGCSVASRDDSGSRALMVVVGLALLARTRRRRCTPLEESASA